MNHLGKDTQHGFLPMEPRVADIFSKLNLLQNGYSGLQDVDTTKHLAEAIERPGDELKRSYARFYHGTAHAQDMTAILEDILDQTLRRAPIVYDQSKSMEQFAAYGLNRSGQNAIVIYMLKMMQDGISLPAPDTKKKKSARKK